LLVAEVGAVLQPAATTLDLLKVVVAEHPLKQLWQLHQAHQFPIQLEQVVLAVLAVEEAAREEVQLLLEQQPQQAELVEYPQAAETTAEALETYHLQIMAALVQCLAVVVCQAAQVVLDLSF
jgi:hypothetical protein